MKDCNDAISPGIGAFLSPSNKGTSSAGACSSKSTIDQTEEEGSNTRGLEDQPVQATSDGEEREEEEVGGANDQTSEEEEEDLMSEASEEESVMDESETATSKIAMLDKDLVGDSSDDDD